MALDRLPIGVYGVPMTTTAHTYKQAMDDLRSGRITADEFRATVRNLKATHGTQATEMAKLFAIAASNR
jgi:hypothetical protein